MRSMTPLRLAPALAVLFSLGCGGSDPAPRVGSVTAVGDPAPQAAVVGTAVARVPAVRVRSTDDQPMSGVAVEWAVTLGDGTAAATTTRTDADGIASAGGWTLGPRIGENWLTATVEGAPPVRFTAEGTPGAPAALAPVVGALTAAVGTVVEPSPRVRVTDRDGNSVPNVVVTFSATTGEGTVTGAVASTNASGQASVGAWRLGTRSGVNALTATVEGLAPLVLEVTAHAGPPTDIAVRDVPATGVAGRAIGTRPMAVVRDAYGNPVVGAPVRFVAQGTVQGAEQTTDAEGVARADGWVLPTEAGPITMAVLVGSGFFHSAEQPFVVLPDEPARLMVSGADQLGTVREPLPDNVHVWVVDQYENRVGGEVVRFTPAAGSGTVARDRAGTESFFPASTEWTLGPQAGVHELRLSVEGRPAVAATLQARALWPPVVADQVEANDAGACLIAAGTVSCWGTNEHGQLGDGTTTARAHPVPVAAASLVAEQVAVGGGFACARTSAGEARCWGRNDRSQTGTSATARRTSPVAVSGGRTFAALFAGDGHACGLEADGTAWCWGANDHGQAVPGAGATLATPTRLDAARFTTLALGAMHSCGVATDGRTLCWGRASEGQLGNGDATAGPGPHVVAGAFAFGTLAAGSKHSCGLTAAGAAHCWGANELGQLGYGTTSHAVPVPVVRGLRFTAISASRETTCGVATDGAGHCWGRSDVGQLGAGWRTPFATSEPVPIATWLRLRWRSIDAGMRSCGLTTDDRVYCWGESAAGLGDGISTMADSPTLVRRP